MILITGAAGKTGRALLQALAERNQPTRAWVRRAEQASGLPATDWIAGDLADPAVWTQACRGVRTLYLICPNMHPGEEQIGSMALDAARHSGVSHFVYHSVLHPQTEEMPHHWNKLRVEEAIFRSGLPFTILQPAAYMQNVLAYWPSITEEGVFHTPYSVQSRISIVDLDDVAQAAATVVTRSGHEGAIYELAGPEPLSQIETAGILTGELGRTVRAEQVPRDDWEQGAGRDGLADYAVETLLAMFSYYDRHGLVGNSNVLGWLLGRRPATFAEFIRRRPHRGRSNRTL